MLRFAVSVGRATSIGTQASGVLVGALLACARALGETMAVAMVCGNTAQLPSSIFDPVRTLTANIALEMGYASELHRSALFVGGLVLLACASALALGAQLLGQRPGGLRV